MREQGRELLLFEYTQTFLYEAAGFLIVHSSQPPDVSNTHANVPCTCRYIWWYIVPNTENC